MKPSLDVRRPPSGAMHGPSDAVLNRPTGVSVQTMLRQFIPPNLSNPGPASSPLSDVARGGQPRTHITK